MGGRVFIVSGKHKRNVAARLNILDPAYGSAKTLEKLGERASPAFNLYTGNLAATK